MAAGHAICYSLAGVKTTSRPLSLLATLVDEAED